MFHLGALNSLIYERRPREFIVIDLAIPLDPYDQREALNEREEDRDPWHI